MDHPMASRPRQSVLDSHSRLAAGGGHTLIQQSREARQQQEGFESEFEASFARVMHDRKESSSRGSSRTPSLTRGTKEGALIYATRNSRGNSLAGSLRASPCASPRLATSQACGAHQDETPLPPPRRNPKVTLKPLPSPRIVSNDTVDATRRLSSIYVERLTSQLPSSPLQSHLASSRVLRAGGAPGQHRITSVSVTSSLRVDPSHHVLSDELSFNIGEGGQDVSPRDAPGIAASTRVGGASGPNGAYVAIRTIIEECNEKVESALDSGVVDAVLCRTLLKATTHLAQTWQDGNGESLMGRTHYNMGRLHRSLGDCTQAQRSLEDSLQAGARAGVERAMVYFELCETFVQLFRLEEALSSVSLAVSDLVSALGITSVEALTSSVLKELLGTQGQKACTSARGAWDVSADTAHGSRKEAGKGGGGVCVEGGEIDIQANKARLLTMMLHRQGEVKQELGRECISSFERAMFIARHLGSVHSDVTSYTKESYVKALKRELSISTGAYRADENESPGNTWQETLTEKPTRLIPMMHATSSKQSSAQTLWKGPKGLSFPSKQRFNKVPESQFFIRLASAKASILQSAYRCHLARAAADERRQWASAAVRLAMARRLQRVWRGGISRRQKRYFQERTQASMKRSAGLLLASACARKLERNTSLLCLRDRLVKSESQPLMALFRSPRLQRLLKGSLDEVFNVRLRDEALYRRQISTVLECRKLARASTTLQNGWRCHKARGKVCSMVGRERGNPLEQMRIARETSMRRRAALEAVAAEQARVAYHASSIQRAIRCHTSRRQMKQQRAYQERVLVQKTQWAILRMQRSCAKCREMKAFVAAKKQRMAVRIGCAWRQRLARRALLDRRHNLCASMVQLSMRLRHHFRWIHRSTCILPIQCTVRCFLSRRRLQMKQLNKIQKQALVADYHRSAAHTISALFRGMMGRHRAQQKQWERAQAHAFALLGRYFVGHAGRLQARRQRYGRYAIRRKESAMMLQKAWRCRVAMGAARAEYWKREARLVVAWRFKMVFCRAKYGAVLCLDAFADSIQGAYQCHLARVALRRRRAGRVLGSAIVRSFWNAQAVAAARDAVVFDLAAKFGLEPDQVCLHCLRAFAVGGKCQVHQSAAVGDMQALSLAHDCTTRTSAIRIPSNMSALAMQQQGATREDRLRIKNAPFVSLLRPVPKP